MVGPALALFYRDARRGITAVLQRPRDHAPGTFNESAILDQPGLHGKFPAQRGNVVVGQADQSFQEDLTDEDRLSLVNHDRQVNGTLLLVEGRVKRLNARIRISTVGVIGLDSSQVGLERTPIEVARATPEEPAARLCLQNGLEP